MSPSGSTSTPGSSVLEFLINIYYLGTGNIKFYLPTIVGIYLINSYYRLISIIISYLENVARISAKVTPETCTVRVSDKEVALGTTSIAEGDGRW